jgi:RNA polymerase sigma-70 factor (ECF subfamily)
LVKPPEPSTGPASPQDTSARENRAAQVAGIFREHNRTLIGFLVSRLHNEQEAMEIAQEAYVKILQLEPKHGAVSYLRSYLFRTAENLAVDRVRQRRARFRLDSLEPVDGLFDEAPAERAAVAEQELALLRCAVAELPDRCQEAFRLHKLEDRPFADVAAAMGVSERMVRKFIGRALIYVRLRREGYSATEAKERVKS